jgi:hypothetical protein
MEIGAIGTHGTRALSRVELEVKVVQETATIQHHNMAETFALV